MVRPEKFCWYSSPRFNRQEHIELRGCELEQRAVLDAGPACLSYGLDIVAGKLGA